MKNVILLIAITYVGITLALMSSCGGSPPTLKNVAISIITDRTDPLLLEPEPSKIFGLLNLDPKSLSRIETGASVRITEISSVDFSQTEDIRIEPVNYHKVNVKARQKEIKKFFEQIQLAFQAKQLNTTMQNSSVYLPIAREANRLSERTSDEKYLIVYSDLVEHSDWLDLYREKNASTENIMNRFLQEKELNDLQGLKVIIRYIPRDSEDNIRFRKLIKVYSKLFESKGASVSFEF